MHRPPQHNPLTFREKFSPDMYCEGNGTNGRLSYYVKPMAYTAMDEPPEERHKSG
jgi:hypothetical protein